MSTLLMYISLICSMTIADIILFLFLPAIDIIALQMLWKNGFPFVLFYCFAASKRNFSGIKAKSIKTHRTHLLFRYRMESFLLIEITTQIVAIYGVILVVFGLRKN